ncbi:TM0106 family RecB-like putative nuclease [Occultella glacieicola]|uniref:TM0106 family RecB-like putative nuclease n=1 Tax=Occultella glacieicola TaxID=2518684 RepID=A0ABY2E489_9MICO|nr:TM0106 family RecB-like putative nuclease [Occultella glacieicola]TDE94845.1 TM0106 family RecB-like putative nuclease [Occultella glacieicola]
MFLLDDLLVYSASDLSTAVGCEFAALRKLDERLGRVPKLEVENAFLDRAARLGNEHEERVLEQYRRRFGAGVVEIGPPTAYTRPGLEEQHARTVAALHAGTDVVAQAGFFDGRFHGRADFLVRDGDVDGRPRYAVVDAKLTRTAKAPAVIQLAAYADQVLRAGIDVAEHTHLHLGDDVVTSHSTADGVAVFRERREQVQRLLDEHLLDDGPVVWGDERYRACLWCDYCSAELEPARDVKLVWGVRSGTRNALRAAGITTIDDLAASTGPVPKVRPAVLERLRGQARLQLRQEAAEAQALGAVAGAAPAGTAGTAGVPAAADPGGTAAPAGGANPAAVAPGPAAATPSGAAAPTVFSEVHTVAALDALPIPDAGDVFFDFEGDPMWVDDDRTEWGLEYLFGLVEAGPEQRYVTFWAHDRAQEAQALRGFLAYVARRRAAHPRMHIYHYAAYEQSALRTLARRHGFGTEEVDSLIADGVLVDLYKSVKDGVRVSQRSYSLKKLEPLYMGTELRDASGVTSGGDSVVAYERATALRDAGDGAGYAERLAELAEYNRYDCISTLRLRDWLLEQRDRAHADQREAAGGDLDATRAGATATLETTPTGVVPPPASPASAAEPEEAPAQALARRLLRGPADTAAPLLAAALDYHRREDEPFWRAHFARLDEPRADVQDTRDVLDVHHARVVKDWSAPEDRRPTRILELTGALGTGSIVGAGAEVFCVYHPPVPDGLRVPEGHVRATAGARVLSRSENADGDDVLVVSEWLGRDVAEHRSLPVLLAPGAPPSAASLRAAIELVAEAVADTADGNTGDAKPGVGSGPLPAQAALDILRRLPPRQRRGASLPHVGVAAPAHGPTTSVDAPTRSDGGRDDGEHDRVGASVLEGEHLDHGHVGALTDALLDAEDSYIAVQGPPGTGKTYLGTRVIADLVLRFGWRVGVVAQSHAVVEHVLRGVVEAGVPGEQVGKRGGSVKATIPTDFRPAVEHDPDAPVWVPLDTYQHQDFLEHLGSAGAVIGGTAWDFANRHRFAVGDLDLLVVDEAGQFSLANTIAVATAARRLLLLGDPQQLPQVSQGMHDAPVDQSALGWLTDGHPTLPADRGYFLDRTWRLHPDLCEAVSTLSYDHRLHSHPRTARRHLDGLDPGVHVVRVSHRGNVVDSPEESAEVVAQIQSLLGKHWTDPAEAANTADTAEAAVTRPLAPSDILVVAAYNAQVQRIRHDLAEAGLDAVRVGTVDKFQGQEAAVVLLSLAASGADDAPRGLGFVLSRNRLNVAISRGKWAAIVVRAQDLTRHLPWNPDELSDLGAFIRLCSDARERRSRRH